MCSSPLIHDPESLVFDANSHPLIVAVRRRIQLDEGLVATARDELLARGRQMGGFVGGWLLGVEDAGPFPAASALVKALTQRVIRAEEERWGVRFSFSFLKAHQGTSPPAAEGWYFEGPHIDSHPALTGSLELLRVLINLAPVPRRFLYLQADRFDLEALGVPVTKDAFTQITPPPDARTHEVAISGRPADSIHMLRFWASVVAHVGVNDPEGSFLASFEAPADFSRIRIFED